MRPERVRYAESLIDDRLTAETAEAQRHFTTLCVLCELGGGTAQPRTATLGTRPEWHSRDTGFLRAAPSSEAEGAQKPGV